MMARLGDYIEQIRGVSYKPEDVCTAQDKDAVAILRANNIQDDGLNFDDLVYVKKSKVSAIQYIKAGDIVVCASSGSKNLVGKAAIATEDMDFSFGAFCKVVRPRKLLPSYAGHYFQSPKYRNKISELAGGANINNIRNEHIDELDIVVPNSDEQERISIELNKICYLISLRKQQLSRLDELVKSRFIELFGDPIFNQMNWDTDAVENLCSEIYGGGTPSKAHPEYYEDGDIPWVSSKDMKTDILYDSQIKINQLGVENSTAKMVPINSVIMVIRSGILKHTLPVAINAVPITVNQDLKVFIPNEKILSVFLMYQFKMLEKDILSGVRAVTADNIEFNSLKEREIIVPPIERQEEFVSFVKQTDKSKFEIQQSLEKLETLKKALMQKYFG